MYANMGPHWAGTMLALMEFALVSIPVVFYRYGHIIRRKSALIRQMQEDKEKLERKRARSHRAATLEALKAADGTSNPENFARAVGVEDNAKHLEKELSV